MSPQALRARCIRRPADDPGPGRRPAGSTSNSRSLATSSVCLHQKYRADLRPSMSAIQQRSRDASNEARNFAAISATRPSNEETQAVFAGVERARGSAPPIPCRRGAARAASPVVLPRCHRRAAARCRPLPRSGVPCRQVGSPSSIAATSSFVLRSSSANACRPLAVNARRYCRRSDGSGSRVISPPSSKILHDPAEVAGIESPVRRRSPWPRDPDGGRVRTAPGPRSARTGSSASCWSSTPSLRV